MLRMEYFYRRDDDAAYVHFVHNITEDVLARGIYSDRGLRQLFERHMSNNEGNLNMVRLINYYYYFYNHSEIFIGMACDEDCLPSQCKQYFVCFFFFIFSYLLVHLFHKLSINYYCII